VFSDITVGKLVNGGCGFALGNMQSASGGFARRGKKAGYFLFFIFFGGISGITTLRLEKSQHNTTRIIKLLSWSEPDDTPLQTVPPIIHTVDYTGGAAIPKEREVGEPFRSPLHTHTISPEAYKRALPKRDSVGLSPVNTVYHFVQATSPNTREVHRK